MKFSLASLVVLAATSARASAAALGSVACANEVVCLEGDVIVVFHCGFAGEGPSGCCTGT